MSATEPDLDVDLEGIDFADTAIGDVRDPYPDYAEARRSAPVQETMEFGSPTYMVFRYDDVAAVLRDPETYASRVYERSMGIVMGPTILQMDGREHHGHRGLIAHFFRRKALLDWEKNLIEPTVHALIDRFASRGEAELVREFTVQFPIRVIATMLGVPSHDYRTFARLSIELISIANNIERGLAASVALRDYFAGVIAERRAEPREDLISYLATASVDGDPLSDEHVYGFLRLLMPAGAETTQRLLGTLLLALLLDPDQLEDVRADRSLLTPAIEEALRWEAPVQRIAREATRDVAIAGVPIPAGRSVTVVLGSANRDETRFPDPDRYDLHRETPGNLAHLAFAEGPHRCLGEHLARLETVVALNAILDRLPGLRLEPGDADPHVHGNSFRSPNCVPVRFDPA